MTLYLCFPMYYYFFYKSKNKHFFILGTIGLWLLLSILLKDVIREDLYGFTNRIPVFVVGIYLGWLCQNGKIRFYRGTWVFFLITLVLGGYLSYQTNFANMEILVPISNCFLPNFLMSISLVFLTSKLLDKLSALHYGKTPTKIFARGIGFFGTISLEFYCIQEWLVERERDAVTSVTGDALGNLVLFLMTTISGFLIYLIAKGLRFPFEKVRLIRTREEGKQRGK